MSLLRALKVNDNLVSLVARHNLLKVNARVLATIGDLLVYHNGSLRRLDLMNARAGKYFENPADQEEEEKMVMFMPGQQAPVAQEKPSTKEKDECVV